MSCVATSSIAANSALAAAPSHMRVIVELSSGWPFGPNGKRTLSAAAASLMQAESGFSTSIGDASVTLGKMRNSATYLSRTRQCANIVARACDLLPTPEAKVHRSRRHGGSADTSAVLIEPTTKRALVDIALLRGDDDRVQAITFLSTEPLRISIRDRLRSCGAASDGSCSRRNQIGAIARVHDRSRRCASCESHRAKHDSNLKPLPQHHPRPPW